MGLTFEFFKLCGVLFSTFIALHYYTALSDILRSRFLPKKMPLEFLDFLFFLILVVAGYLSFIGLRSLLYRFMNLDSAPRISKIGGLILGLVRGFFLIGLLTFTLAISSVSYFRDSVKSSYLGSRAVTISPWTYNWLLNNIVIKFSAQEKFNPTVSEVTGRMSQK